MGAGEVLLRKPALASILHGEFQGRRCDRCFRSSADSPTALKRCGRCRAAHYCGRACQEADWPDHRVECAARSQIAKKLAVQGLIGDGALADALLVGRCLRREPTRACSDNPQETLAELETLRGRTDDAELNRLQRLASAVASTPKLLPETCNSEDALDALCRFRNNNFAIVDDLFVSIGAGVFPRG